jgi:hypothetical protein
MEKAMIQPKLTTLLVACSIPLFLQIQHPAIADTVATSSETEGCAYDRAEMLALDKNAFDQDFEGGWRSVAHQDGCEIEAADLIRDYIVEHDIQATIFFFHQAQLRAMAGQTEQALELFQQTRKPASETDRFGWNHYVDATIAFLNKDQEALLAAKAALEATRKPDDFNPVDVNGNPVVHVNWPPNLNVVDGFIDCFERDYDWAYSNCSRPFLKGNAESK